MYIRNLIVMFSLMFFLSNISYAQDATVTKSLITPAGKTLKFLVCKKADDQGELDVNGFPKDGWKLDLATCYSTDIEMYNTEDPEDQGPRITDFSVPITCSRLSLSETPRWEQDHEGWLVKKTACPDSDGNFKEFPELDATNN